jgi:hypothetical protein
MNRACAELKERIGINSDWPPGCSRSGSRIIINGEKHVWHHQPRKGHLELIPQKLHNASQADPGTKHAGMALWWMKFD